MLPYSRLRSANVLSTIDCITLCMSGKPKRLTFISSTSTLDTSHYVQLSRTLIAAGSNGVPETDNLEGSRKGLGTVYGQTKWASEHMSERQTGVGLLPPLSALVIVLVTLKVESPSLTTSSCDYGRAVCKYRRALTLVITSTRSQSPKSAASSLPRPYIRQPSRSVSCRLPIAHD